MTTFWIESSKEVVWEFAGPGVATACGMDVGMYVLNADELKRMATLTEILTDAGAAQVQFEFYTTDELGREMPALCWIASRSITPEEQKELEQAIKPPPEKPTYDVVAALLAKHRHDVSSFNLEQMTTVIDKADESLDGKTAEKLRLFVEQMEQVDVTLAQLRFEFGV